jgi:hypothetical protein
MRGGAALIIAGVLVTAALLVANYVGWLRLKPEMLAVAWIEDIPNYEAHIVNMAQRAIDRSKGSPDSLLPIYDVRNPGFFLLVAELYTRAGATTPFPLEITSIVLYNVGAICFFVWVLFLFGDLVAATIATVFLVLSKFFLFFPGVTHTFPYEFVFFNVTMLLFVLFLRTDNRAYLIASLAAMFMTCMNYWFYYMSTWIIMVGLWWQYRGRPSLKVLAVISMPPVAAAAVTAVMVMSLFGGIGSGVKRLAEIFIARTFDQRLPGGTWLPDQKFMQAGDWWSYPATVASRIEWSYSIDFVLFSLSAVCGLFLLSLRNRASCRSALILLLGGFSWYYVMFQHTHIHPFVGQYSFMAICTIFGLTISELLFFTRRSIRLAAADRRSAMLELTTAAILLGAIWVSVWPYADNTYHLVKRTAETSRWVSERYAAAVSSICRRRGEVTLADLQSASADWGLGWRPSVIADTAQLPRCSG